VEKSRSPDVTLYDEVPFWTNVTAPFVVTNGLAPPAYETNPPVPRVNVMGTAPAGLLTKPAIAATASAARNFTAIFLVSMSMVPPQMM
jgi:hypothetical protein